MDDKAQGGSELLPRAGGWGRGEGYQMTPSACQVVPEQ